MAKYALVGDVGGTNARLVLCDIASGEVSQARTYSGLGYPNLEAVIRIYLEKHKVEVKDGRIATVYPITGDQVAMANHTWAFSIAEMKKNLGFNHLEITNNLIVVSMAIPTLKKEYLAQFGGTKLVEGKPIAVCGVGTGLGVARLAHIDKRWVSLSGEGGHVDFVPNSEEEDIILEVLYAGVGHAPVKHVLSGPGLVSLYRAIAKADDRLPENLKPKDITERALVNGCTDCCRALPSFCVIMGHFGGNLTLNLGTSSGVFVADGIVSRLPEFFKASGFCAAFEGKRRFRKCVHDISVYLIVHDNSGLLGSDVHLRQTLGHTLQTLPVISEGNPSDNLLSYTTN